MGELLGQRRRRPVAQLEQLEQLAQFQSVGESLTKVER